jgi:hypothetical protein
MSEKAKKIRQNRRPQRDENFFAFTSARATTTTAHHMKSREKRLRVCADVERRRVTT